MMKFSTAVTRIVTTGLLMAIAGLAAAQQAYPSKPIRSIVPFPPGGTIDILARLIGQKLTESWGQPVIVDNRPGANMIIGTEALAKSLPDGYTIQLVNMTHVINPLVVPNLLYDTIKDFAPVSTLTNSQYVLTINFSIPANNLQEFITYAKSRPGQLNYASSGIASADHLTTEILNNMVGIMIQHIPYKGAALILNDLVGGEVQMYLATALTTLPYIKTGRIKALAISGETRVSVLPQVPTFTEAGVPGFDVKNWFGVVAPAGTPKAIVDKLSAEIAKILAMPDTRAKLASQGGEPFISTPEQFAALMKADMAMFAKIIKSANIKLE